MHGRSSEESGGVAGSESEHVERLDTTVPESSGQSFSRQRKTEQRGGAPPKA